MVAVGWCRRRGSRIVKLEKVWFGHLSHGFKDYLSTYVVILFLYSVITIWHFDAVACKLRNQQGFNGCTVGCFTAS